MKIWKTSTCDDKFRELIQLRDKLCMRCGRICGRLEVSHFYPRSNASTRFDPNNCILLGYPHHWGNAQGWEFHKQCCYKEWMIKWLGQKEFDELEKRAHSVMPMEKSRKQFQESYQTMKNLFS